MFLDPETTFLLTSQRFLGLGPVDDITLLTCVNNTVRIQHTVNSLFWLVFVPFFCLCCRTVNKKYRGSHGKISQKTKFKPTPVENICFYLVLSCLYALTKIKPLVPS